MIKFFRHIHNRNRILHLQNQMSSGHLVEITTDSYRDGKIRKEKHD